MVRMPKTGSTSVIKGLFGGIERAADVSLGVFPDAWTSLYSFAFVRNPYDRLVSAFLMFREYAVVTDAERNVRDALTIEGMLDVVEDPAIAPSGDAYLSKMKLHSMPMTSPFYHLDRVTDICRFEAFGCEYRRLAAGLGLKVEETPHFRKSQRESFQAYFNRRDRQRAQDVFRHDLSTFGYSFDAEQEPSALLSH